MRRLLVACLCLSHACSLFYVDPSPAEPRPGEYPRCTEHYDPVIIDAILSLVVGGVTFGIGGEPDDPKRQRGIAATISSSLLLALSAVIGASWIARCREQRGRYEFTPPEWSIRRAPSSIDGSVRASVSADAGPPVRARAERDAAPADARFADAARAGADGGPDAGLAGSVQTLPDE